MRNYTRFMCPWCQHTVSANGLAKTSHMRKHVREGKLLEVLYLLATGDHHRGIPIYRTELQFEDRRHWPDVPPLLNKINYNPTDPAYHRLSLKEVRERERAEHQPDRG